MVIVIYPTEKPVQRPVTPISKYIASKYAIGSDIR